MKNLIIALVLICCTSLFAEDSALRDEALKSYLLGTWVGADDKPGMTSEQTFRKDGTFEGLVVTRIKSPSGVEAERRIVFSGIWKVEGDVCIETAQRIDPQIIKMPDTKRYRISDISPASHRSTNTETKKSNMHRRKEG
jgi:hypothetical protein